MRPTSITSTAIAVSAILAASISAGHAAPQADGKQVLRGMMEAEKTVSFVAHQVTIVYMESNLTSEQDVYRSGVKGMRLEYTSPGSLAGELMVDDGQKLTHYIPSRNVAKIRPSMLAMIQTLTVQTAEALHRGSMVVELQGRDRVAGRDAMVVILKPTDTGNGPIRKFWVDAGKHVRLKAEDTAPNGTVTSVSYYTRIDFRNSIPDDKFHFEPPAGTRIHHDRMAEMMPLQKARDAAGFKVLVPSYLPQGFKEVGAAVRPFRGAKMVTIRYSDGVSSFSLFQSPGNTLAPKFRRRLESGPLRPGAGICSWRIGDLNLTIVGQIPQAQLERIAASVR